MRERLIFCACLVLSAGMVFADTLTLRNGQVVQGTYLGGSAREIRMDLGDHVQTYPLEQVSALQFDSGPLPGNGSPDASAAPPPSNYNSQNVPPPPGGTYPSNGNYPNSGNYPNNTYASNTPNSPSGPAPMGITIPQGTILTVRMVDAVNSDSTSLGRTYRASLDEPVVVNGQTVILRGADVVTKVVEDQQSGRITGRTELALALQSVAINGQQVPISSQQVTEASSSRGARSAGVIGGGAALGTVLGAIAGGGRGAAIGAVSGAAVGTGAEVLTHGQRVKIPSETRLNFTLNNPVNL